MTRPTLDIAPARRPVRSASEPFAFIYDQSTGRRQIPIEVDRKYRKALLEAAAKAPRARRYFLQAFEAGPDREGVQGAIRYFGKDLDLYLKVTAQMVDNLEVAMPGFKRWLEVTGFGNDKNFIKGFIRWIVPENGAQVEHILPSVRRVMKS